MNGTPLLHGNGVHRGRGIMNGTPTSDRNSKMKMVVVIAVTTPWADTYLREVDSRTVPE